MFSTLLFFLLLTAQASTDKPKSIPDICVEYLGADTRYSIVLNGDGTHALLTGSTLLGRRGAPPISQVLSGVPDAEELLQNVPELEDFEWQKEGPHSYSASSQFAHYRIDESILTMEMLLPTGEPGEAILRHLLYTLERERVAAMISGFRAQISVYRLELSDHGTQRALQDFLSFMRGQY